MAAAVTRSGGTAAGRPQPMASQRLRRRPPRCYGPLSVERPAQADPAVIRGATAEPAQTRPAARCAQPRHRSVPAPPPCRRCPGRRSCPGGARPGRGRRVAARTGAARTGTVAPAQPASCTDRRSQPAAPAPRAAEPRRAPGCRRSTSGPALAAVGLQGRSRPAEAPDGGPPTSASRRPTASAGRDPRARQPLLSATSLAAGQAAPLAAPERCRRRRSTARRSEESVQHGVPVPPATPGRRPRVAPRTAASAASAAVAPRRSTADPSPGRARRPCRTRCCGTSSRCGRCASGGHRTVMRLDPEHLGAVDRHRRRPRGRRPDGGGRRGRGARRRPRGHRAPALRARRRRARPRRRRAAAGRRRAARPPRRPPRRPAPPARRQDGQDGPGRTRGADGSTPGDRRPGRQQDQGPPRRPHGRTPSGPGRGAAPTAPPAPGDEPTTARRLDVRV